MKSYEHWLYQEPLVYLKMQEVERQMEQNRLLREARLASGPGRLARLLASLQRSWMAREPKPQKRASAKRQAYRPASDEAI